MLINKTCVTLNEDYSFPHSYVLEIPLERHWNSLEDPQKVEEQSRRTKCVCSALATWEIWPQFFGTAKEKCHAEDDDEDNHPDTHCWLLLCISLISCTSNKLASLEAMLVRKCSY